MLLTQRSQTTDVTSTYSWKNVRNFETLVCVNDTKTCAKDFHSKLNWNRSLSNSGNKCKFSRNPLCEHFWNEIVRCSDYVLQFKNKTLHLVNLSVKFYLQNNTLIRFWKKKCSYMSERRIVNSIHTAQCSFNLNLDLYSSVKYSQWRFVTACNVHFQMHHTNRLL